MCEPYLSNRVSIIEKCLPYIKDAFIIGELNYNNEIVNKLKTIYSFPEGYPEELKKYIDDIYSVRFQTELYNYYRDNPKIFFKKGFFDMILKLYK